MLVTGGAGRRNQWAIAAKPVVQEIFIDLAKEAFLEKPENAEGMTLWVNAFHKREYAYAAQTLSRAELCIDEFL